MFRLRPTRQRLLLAILAISVLSISLGYIFFLLPSEPPYSPIGQQIITSDNNATATKLIYGFLPYWNYSSLEAQELSELTHLAYFSLTPDAQGNIKTHNTPTQLEPGWHNYQKPAITTLFNQAHNQGIKLHLVISAFDESLLTSLLESPNSQSNLITQIVDQYQKHTFSGINIDFEPPNPLSHHAPNFTQFIKNLKSALNQVDAANELFVDIYPGAAKSENIWQLPALNPYVDRYIVMTYDYHHRASTKAGPIAPLYSHDHHNILSHLQQLTKVAPPEKLLLGIPTYGYQWQTIDITSRSQTYPNSAKLYKISDLDGIITNPAYQLHWDQQTASAWYSYQDTADSYQLHIDTPPSIRLKKDLVHQSHMAGFAIWALGYHHTPLGLGD